MFADEVDEGAKESAQFWVKGEKLDKKVGFLKIKTLINSVQRWKLSEK